MRDLKVVELDGFQYHVVPLPPRRALKLLVRVLRATGPGIVTIMAGASGGKKLLDMDFSALGDMARTAMMNLTPDEHDAILGELLEPVRVVDQGKLKPVITIFDAHFLGRLPSALRLEWEALAENYRDFGDALAAFAGTSPAGAPASPSVEST